MMINDPASQQFTDQNVQDQLDVNRDDIRMEPLHAEPVVVNTASTNNQAEFVYADFYSRYQWWESDATLQGYLSGSPWKVLTPLASDYITGHFQFQLTPFVNGTAPGQWPPVYATGKIYDLNCTAADLLTFWASALAGVYDISVNGQTLKRSDMRTAKLEMAAYFRRMARPKIAKMRRDDVARC
jgi:hypothetical protein